MTPNMMCYGDMMTRSYVCVKKEHMSAVLSTGPPGVPGAKGDQGKECKFKLEEAGNLGLFNFIL